eukprot:maker-scaffold_15-snap-gene-2.27-mRNA-1 protein AED:0.02 eAED:0.03 QI:247/0/0.66/1/0.5/0.33/3/1065/219
MAQYGKIEYWDERYTNEVRVIFVAMHSLMLHRDAEPFDWYQRYSNISEKLTGNLDKSSQILMLGCGVTEDMFQDGYASIVNIDVSKVVIDQMTERHKDKSTVSWKVMNAQHLDFEDEHFDAIIDKGTLDSILCGEGSTNNAAMTLKECIRVLKPGGKYICISYGTPDNRLGYLEAQGELNWEVSIDTVPKPTVTGEPLKDENGTSVHYIYKCTKHSAKN